jgi:hypothetical protein
MFLKKLLLVGFGRRSFQIIENSNEERPSNAVAIQ